MLVEFVNYTLPPGFWTWNLDAWKPKIQIPVEFYN